MEDQGIMALPQAGMQAPTAQPVAQPGQAEMAAFEQARMQINPKEFGDSLLEEARNADPAAVNEFVEMLQSINLPPEAIDALGQVVDAILADPQNYPQIRADLLAEGVPEEILPPEFDPNFFAALNMALDQMSSNAMAPAPQAFAKGGIVQLNPIAASLANQGRRGDRLLAHITHGEARLLRRRGGSGTINPDTGLPEFFIDKIVKGAGRVLKGVGRALKDVGRGIKKFASSSIGRVVTTVALGFFLGPAAAAAMGVSAPAAVAAMSGFVGGFGSSMLAGQNLKSALKTGAFNALLAGTTVGVTTPGAFSSVSGAPTTFSQGLSQQVDKFTGGIKSLIGGNVSQAPAPGPQTAAPGPQPSLPNVSQAAAPDVMPPDVASGDFIPRDVASGQAADTAIARAGLRYNPANGSMLGPIEEYNVVSGGTPSAGAYSPPASTPQTFAERGIGAIQNMGKRVMDFYNPPADMAAQGQFASRYGLQVTDPSASNYAFAKDVSPKIQDAIIKAGQPAFGTGTRLAATGLGALALTGGFKQEPVQAPNIVPRVTGQDLLRDNPSLYGVRIGGAQTVYPQPMFLSNGGIAAVAPRKYALGGYANGGKPQHFPRRTGQISGPGTETSDSIPAMLSDGEFVMTAKAVRGAGGGSRREGARRMYQMMRAFERKA